MHILELSFLRHAGFQYWDDCGADGWYEHIFGRLLSETRPGATARLRPQAGLHKCQRWIGVLVVPPASHLTARHPSCSPKCHLTASPWVASGGPSRPCRRPLTHRNYEAAASESYEAGWHSPRPVGSSLPPLSCLSVLPLDYLRAVPGSENKFMLSRAPLPLQPMTDETTGSATHVVCG